MALDPRRSASQNLYNALLSTAVFLFIKSKFRHNRELAYQYMADGSIYYGTAILFCE